MAIKMKKSIIVVMILLIVLTVVSIFKYREFVFATRTIKDKIDIGGYSLKVNCYGRGEPTIIFESGNDTPNYTWELVQSEISKSARTFSYDRAGVGDSDSGKWTGTSLDQVHELHALLNKVKVEGPYIIVAHSIGGYNARLFAATYPKEVLGVVFVDSSHEDQSKLFTGVFELSAKQVKETRVKDALRNIPIVVLTSGINGKDERWLNYQKDLVTLSDYSKHIVIENSGHYIQRDNPQVVIDSIQELIVNTYKLSY